MHCVVFLSTLSCSGRQKQKTGFKQDQCLSNYGGKGAGALEMNMKG